MKLSTKRPTENGWYYVAWELADTPRPTLVYIRHFPKGTLFEHKDYWTWGKDEYDDPEDIELDVIDPDMIFFSEKVK